MTMRCVFLRQIINRTHDACSPVMLLVNFLFSHVGEIASRIATLHLKRDSTDVTRCFCATCFFIGVGFITVHTALTMH